MSASKKRLLYWTFNSETYLLIETVQPSLRYPFVSVFRLKSREPMKIPIARSHETAAQFITRVWHNRHTSSG